MCTATNTERSLFLYVKLSFNEATFGSNIVGNKIMLLSADAILADYYMCDISVSSAFVSALVVGIASGVILLLITSNIA
jgi:hypothetical protein